MEAYTIHKYHYEADMNQRQLGQIAESRATNPNVSARQFNILKL